MDFPACTADWNVTDSYCGLKLKEFRFSHFTMYGISATVMCVIGLVSNMLNVILLTRKNASTSATNAILTGISVADFIYLIFILIHILLNYGIFTIDICVGQSYSFQLLSLITHRIYLTMHSITVLVTLMLTIWRYFAVAFPLKMRQWCNRKRTILVIVICYLFVFLCNIPLYMREMVNEVNVIRNDQIIPTVVVNNGLNCSLYDIEFTELATRNNCAFRTFGFWFRGTLLQLLPSLLVVYFSFILVRALYKSSQQRSTLTFTSNSITLNESCVRTTKMVLVVAVLFFVTDFTQGTLLILGASLGKAFYFTCYTDLMEVNDFMVIVNCSLNFMIYLFMCRQFRRNFNRLFMKKFIESSDSVKSIDSTMSELRSNC
ncbi:hypothetical protein CHUAL_009127 [Chamberlinius hualienensis]